MCIITLCAYTQQGYVLIASVCVYVYINVCIYVAKKLAV